MFQRVRRKEQQRPQISVLLTSAFCGQARSFVVPAGFLVSVAQEVDLPRTTSPLSPPTLSLTATPFPALLAGPPTVNHGGRESRAPDA